MTARLNKSKPLFLFYLSDRGRALCEKLSDYFPEASIEKLSKEKVAKCWPEARGLIFVMACGIVVRTIAELIKSKKEDPAVVVLDEAGKFAISLLSGHLGGANELACEIAALIGAQSVITTASDLSGLPALDLWAEENDLILEPEDLIPEVTACYLRNRSLKTFTDYPVNLPEAWERVERPEEADLVVSYRKLEVPKKVLFARPRVLFLGLGFNRGTPTAKIEEAVSRVFEKHGLSLKAIRGVGTLDHKLHEPGFSAWLSKRDLKALGFSAEALNRAVKEYGLEVSEAARAATGALAVAEPAALLGAGPGSRLIVSKEKTPEVTVAVAEALRRKGKLFIVGTGPGALEELTPLARRAIRLATHVVGYHRYLALIKPLLSGKQVYGTGMTQEVDRVKKALELAQGGYSVALVSGGDSGIYGLAGLVFELMREEDLFESFEVEVIPGLSALNACAARLGAPLMHDFAVISLSDRLTPWETIEKRLRAAAEADFVIVIYNPKSRSRREHLARARDILLEYRSGKTPVGLARAVSREEETLTLTTLEDMLLHEIDMQTTVFIGNSETFIFHNWLVTPRGYRGRRF